MPVLQEMQTDCEQQILPCYERPEVKIEMLGDRMLVRPLKSNERTRSNLLFIPETSRDGTPWVNAEVVHVGPGGYSSAGALIPMQCKEGDVIIFFRQQATGEQMVVPDGDEELLCIRQNHVLGILRDLSAIQVVSA
jgi:chaperonin GroES